VGGRLAGGGNGSSPGLPTNVKNRGPAFCTDCGSANSRRLDRRSAKKGPTVLVGGSVGVEGRNKTKKITKPLKVKHFSIACRYCGKGGQPGANRHRVEERRGEHYQGETRIGGFMRGGKEEKLGRREIPEVGRKDLIRSQKGDPGKQKARFDGNVPKSNH